MPYDKDEWEGKNYLSSEKWLKLTS